MKKTLDRKLTLQRDTLRTLESPSLHGVAAGAPTDFSCHNSCATFTQTGCLTENCTRFCG